MTNTPQAPAVIHTILLQKTCLGSNNNKWYRIEVLDNGYFRKFWGRVGDQGQSQLEHGTRADAEEVAKRKVANGYQRVKLASFVATPETKLFSDDPKVDRLIHFINDEAGDYISSYLATTIDQISQDQIKTARKVLEDLVKAPAWQVPYVAEAYYNLIPTQLPRKIDRNQVAKELTEGINEQIDRLDQLEAGVATAVAQATGQNKQALGTVELSVVETSEQSYAEIAKYLHATGISRTTPFEVFRVLIPSEREAYETDPLVQANNNLTYLFHGSRAANWRHILKDGLKIPSRITNGWRLGPGIYFADKAQRSRSYASGNTGWAILLSEVALGKYYSTSGMLDGLPRGYDSTHGYGTWSDLGDEFVIYRASQASIQYFILFRNN